MGVFVEQEAVRFNKLLVVIRRTLVNLQKSIDGTVVMSADLEQMFNNFLINRRPELWEQSDLNFLTLKPLSS